MLTIRRLTLFDAASFAPFTLSHYWRAYAGSGFAPPFLVYGAIWDDEPAGLVLSQVQLDRSTLLASLFVRREYRQRGIGAALMRQLESGAVELASSEIELRYELETAGSHAFERTLARCGWPARGDRIQAFVLDGQITSASWFRDAVLPATDVISPWQTVSPEERQVLIASHADDVRSEDPWVPRGLEPERFDSAIDATTSLVLRRHGRVIGWTLTTEIDATTIHYRNVYVRASCNRVGRSHASLALIAEAVRRQADARGLASRGRFEVAASNTAFLRFIERHLQRDLLSSSTLQRLIKPLATVT